MNPEIPDNVKEAVLGQGRLIAERLRKEAGMSFGNNNTPAQITWMLSETTGEMVAALTVAGITYHEANGKLIRQREQSGRTAYSELLPDREWSKWTEIAPPPSRSAGN